MLASARKNLERFARKGWQSSQQARSRSDCGEKSRARSEEFARAKRPHWKRRLDQFLSKPPLQNPEVFDPPGKETAKWLKKLEKAGGGPMPISLRAWFEQVGGVALLGSHEDPLMVTSPRRLLEMIDAEEAGDWMALWIAPGRSAQSQYQRRRSLHRYRIPNASADAEFEFEWHRTTFVESISERPSSGAGFLGWERDKNPPKEAITGSSLRDARPL